MRDPTWADAPKLRLWTSSLVFLGTSGSVPTAKRGARGRCSAGAERILVDCGEGHSVSFCAPQSGSSSSRDLPDALPRRPLPRPAGDAEDLRARGPRGAADRLRPSGPQRSLRDPAARLQAAELRADARRAAAGRRRRAARLPDRGVRGRARLSANGTRSSRRPARSASTSRAASVSASRRAALRTPAGRRVGRSAGRAT